VFKTVCLLMILICSAVVADELRDPTRPLRFVQAVNSDGQEIKLELNSILVGPNRKIAIINGQSLVQGQQLKGTNYQVISIQKNSVTLTSGEVRRTLTMVESRVKR